MTRNMLMRWRMGRSCTRTGVRFRLWAPGEDQVGIEIDGHQPVPMARQPGRLA